VIFGRKPLSGKAAQGVVAFTIIETVVLSAWLYLALAHQTVFSVLVLAVGLAAEHYLATQIGKYDP